MDRIDTILAPGVENSESKNTFCWRRLYHLALVTIFVQGPIRQPEGMMIVEEREPQPWKRGRGIGMHQKIARTHDIVPARAIQSVVHFVPPQPMAENECWYLNNNVDLGTFNLIF
jgi:hypothetical protein